MNLQPSRILVIRFSSIGDILLATPLLRLLRQRFSGARIDMVIKEQYKPLLAHNPYIDSLYTLNTPGSFRELRDLRKRLPKDYDLVVDIHNNLRSRYLTFRMRGKRKICKHKFKRFLLVAFNFNVYRKITPVYRRYLQTVTKWGITDDGEGLELYVDESVNKRISTWLDAQDVRPQKTIVGIVPGASFWNKRWPVEKFSAVCEHLCANCDARILLFGSSDEQHIAQAIAESFGKKAVNCAGELSLIETACALSRCDAVITNDSGLMHMATALKIPTVAIFGPTTRELGFFPTGPNTAVVERPDLYCRPCTHIGMNRCPEKHFRCMKEIEPEEVWQQVAAFSSSSELKSGDRLWMTS